MLLLVQKTNWQNIKKYWCFIYAYMYMVPEIFISFWFASYSILHYKRIISHSLCFVTTTAINIYSSVVCVTKNPHNLHIDSYDMMNNKVSKIEDFGEKKCQWRIRCNSGAADLKNYHCDFKILFIYIISGDKSNIYWDIIYKVINKFSSIEYRGWMEEKYL